MPVNVLLCEGGERSSDSAVVRAISGLSTVKPVGGKGQLKSYMRWKRVQGGYSDHFALRDRDFDDLDLDSAKDQPREWLERDNQISVHFGWIWARNCIENYLIDPDVVDRVVGRRLDRSIYLQQLELAAISLSHYTAARYALAQARPGSLMLENAWGEKCGPDAKHHVLPLQRGLEDCYRGIESVVQNLTQTKAPKVKEIRDQFDILLPTCLPDGERFKNYLVYFSGKDLLGVLEPFLEAQGFGKAGNFRAEIVGGITDSDTDVWEWLPEWKALRQLIQTF